MRVRTLGYQRAAGWSEELPTWDSPSTLVLVFGASSYLDDPEPLTALAAAYPSSVVVGCSTSGEINGVTIEDETLTVAVVHFETVGLRAASAMICADASHTAGLELGKTLEDPHLRGVLVLSEGLNVNGSELATGLNDSLHTGVTVTGGLAGDGDRFERTWVLVDGRPQRDKVVAVGFYGDKLVFGHGSKGGWDMFGPEREVTRSHNNVLYELDGRPALALYKQYLGSLASGLPATALLFPLALRAPDGDKQLVRTVLGVDETDQSMTFAGDVPEGHRAQLMQANFDRVIGGAEDAARSAEPGAGHSGDLLCIAISCVGRRLVLGARTEEELEATRDVLPDGTHLVGFYSYGELSPYTPGTCDLHNQTMTLTTIAEHR